MSQAYRHTRTLADAPRAVRAAREQPTARADPFAEQLAVVGAVALGVLAHAALTALLPLVRQEGDLRLYFEAARRWSLGEVPYQQFAFEYPPAALVFFRATYEAAARLHVRFYYALAAALACLDGVALLATYVAARGAGGRGLRSPWTALAACWLGLALCTSVLFTRFDLAPGALGVCAVALVSIAQGPIAFAAAGAAFGVAVALKLYAAVLAPALAVAIWRRGGIRALCVAGTAAAVAAIALTLPAAAPAPAESLSPLSYHWRRGIQIQSSWGAALLVLHQLGAVRVAVGQSFGAAHLEPSPHCLGLVGGALQLAFAGLAALAVARGAPLTRGALAAFAGFVAFCKVGSPQFALALVPLAACAIGESPWAVVVVLGALVLQALEYPAHYVDLMAHRGPWAALVLVRLMLVAGVAVWSSTAWLRMRLSRRQPREPPLTTARAA